MKRKITVLYILVGALLFTLTTQTLKLLDSADENVEASTSISQKEEEAILQKETLKNNFLKKLLNDFSFQYKLFKRAKVINGKYTYSEGNYTVIFTVNPTLEEKYKKLFKTYKLRYGAFVLLDAKTGKVLSAVSSIDFPDLTVKNTFPTASTFKIITAAAALEEKLATPKTVLLCGGTGDSCSPTVWLSSWYKVKREFDTSFATSANPFFGNLGRLIGETTLIEYAKKFGFNRHDYGFPWGFIRKPLDDNDLALMAAGLGESRISPFHEALISLTIENNGVMLKPSLIEKVIRNGKVVYSFKPEVLGKVVSPETAKEIKDMMLLTVKMGTASGRKFFRLLKRRYPFVRVGGKTGTLSEKTFPEGRCEWFTGFAELGDKKLAFSSLGINESRYYITGYDLSALALINYVKLNRTYAFEGGKP